MKPFIDSFVTRLRLKSRDCDYHDPEEMIRDRIVFGTNSSKIREKLITVGRDLTLQKAKLRLRPGADEADDT